MVEAGATPEWWGPAKQVISTSEIKISVLIMKKDTNKALMALHKEFDLEK